MWNPPIRETALQRSSANVGLLLYFSVSTVSEFSLVKKEMTGARPSFTGFSDAAISE